jgi:hypothetical protein
MAEPITGIALKNQKSAILAAYEKFLSSQHERAVYAPELVRCSVLDKYPQEESEYEALVRLDIVEHQYIPRYNPIARGLVLFYGVRNDGAVVFQNGRNLKEFDGAEEFYKQPLVEFLQNSPFDPFSRARARERTRAIHEELAATLWHPDRVAALLERGGWELVDAL